MQSALRYAIFDFEILFLMVVTILHNFVIPAITILLLKFTRFYESGASLLQLFESVSINFKRLNF